MSTIRANTFLDSAGGNTATINGITPALASQGQAETGSDNATLMTPLRTAQAINTLSGMILLGTLSNTGVATQTLSPLNLTGYSRLFIDVSGVAHDNANSRGLQVGTARMSDQRTSADLFYGMTQLNLSDGAAVSQVDTSSTNTRNTFIQLSGYTNASTSIVFSWSGAGNFRAGTIRVYGVK